MISSKTVRVRCRRRVCVAIESNTNCITFFRHNFGATLDSTKPNQCLALCVCVTTIVMVVAKFGDREPKQASTPLPTPAGLTQRPRQSISSTAPGAATTTPAPPASGLTEQDRDTSATTRTGTGATLPPGPPPGFDSNFPPNFGYNSGFDYNDNIDNFAPPPAPTAASDQRYQYGGGVGGGEGPPPPPPPQEPQHYNQGK